jgi:primosomal protein N' (replication factor Y)
MVPEHEVLKLAAKQDYDSFYELEIRLRQIQSCPPFGDLATVTFTGQEEGRVLRGAVKFRDGLSGCLKTPAYSTEQCTVLGPAPCPVPKINYNFRYRLSLRCRMTRALRGLLGHLLRQFSQDRENRGVSAFVDVNGFDE